MRSTEGSASLAAVLVLGFTIACTGDNASPDAGTTDAGARDATGFVFEKVIELTPPPPSETPDGALDLVYHPDGSGAYFVGYRFGLLEWRDATHAVVERKEIEVRRGRECGLLAIEVDPDFETNHRFYVGYCVPNSGVNLESFDWNSTSSTVEPTDTSTVFSMVKSPNDHHNLGDIGWDEEKNLWFTYGDGNRAFDYLPKNLMDLRGKLLRVQPYRDGRHGYDIPADNPYVGDPTALDEIVAWGFKSAYRSTYAKGTWFLADVGHESFEEVNVHQLSSDLRNFGYPDCEGNMALDLSYELTGEPCGLVDGYKAPDLFYAHDPDQPVIAEDPLARATDVGQWAICGGVLITSNKYGERLQDHYVYTDIARGFVRAARFDGEKLVDDRHVTHLGSIFQFSLGPDGHVYALADNVLYRLDARGP